MSASLGAYLRRVREGLGLTLRDVARITGGKPSCPYISQLEMGHAANPSVVTLHRLAAAYAIDFADLCERACVGSKLPEPPPICPTCGQVVAALPTPDETEKQG